MRKIVNLCFVVLAICAVVFGLIGKYSKLNPEQEILSGSENNTEEEMPYQHTNRTFPNITIPQN
jgi:hypothetical protein